ncbi:MAG: PorV/PorQ family protein [Bacteroidetes bacterium]|nr:PorV/PorQ family protein [Bacteroidota bacterium]
MAYGLNISNIGAKMSYSEDKESQFIPTNLRLGGAGTFKLDPYNRITVALDMNKLLVPTPPLLNSQGQIVSGSDPRDLTLLQGLFRSLGDAPDGAREELQEIIGNFGVEYAYANAEGEDLFFVRAGYASEHRQKVIESFYRMVGARYQVFGLDVAYLIPTRRTNPLSETLRFTLSLRFGDKKEEGN